jgi:hypothetical protein
MDPPGHRSKRTVAVPLAYLITFTCYGTVLHGDEAGSIDRHHNIPLAPLLPSNPRLRNAELEVMRQAPYRLDDRRRQLVLSEFREVCEYRGWALAAAHVRETHVHLVVHAAEPPEKVMADLALCKPKAQRSQSRLSRPQALDAPWQHALSVEARSRRGRITLCDPRAGRADGGI